MPARYATLKEEVFEREAELLCEEFRLYSIIVFHSYPDDNGVKICRKTPEDLCQIYPSLDLHNTYRRIRRLTSGEFDKSEIKLKDKKVDKMLSPWLKKTKDGIIPLVGFENVEAPDFSEGLTRTANEENVPRNGHLSKFSKEEILQYIKICQKRGQKITNPAGLASWLYETGKKDDFIQEILYPENSDSQPADEPKLDGDGLPILDDIGREKALGLLLDTINDGIDIDSFKEFYRSEDWQWLMKKLKETAMN